ncbi:MAG: hypothetical protein J7L03_05600 [Caldisericaceae bacterium]|nr:hypothetical protein [Caldisericaceae bacterium]
MKKFLISLLVLLMCTTLFYGAGNVYALTVTSITASPNTPGANATYGIQMNIEQTLSANTDYIKVTFPSGFTIPSSISNGTVRVNGNVPYSVTVNGLSVYIYPSQNLAVGALTVYIYSSAGIRNPSTGGVNYPIAISTSKETTAVSYNLYIQSAVRGLTASVSPNGAGSYATYTISFIPNISLNTSDHIYIVFPYDTTLPENITPSYITINGYACSYVTKSGNLKLDIRPPFGMNAGYTFTIIINDSFGIKNPTNPGTYTLQLATSREPAYAVSNPYDIVGSNITNLSVSLSPNTAGSVSTYSIWFTTGPSGALQPNNYIKIVFPDDTYIPTNTSASYITLNGHNCTNKYVSGRTLTIYIPSGFSLGNNSTCNIIIPTQFGIRNPTKPGTYTLSLSTSADTVPAVSNPYTIVGTSVSSLEVNVDPPVQNTIAEYTISFTTSQNGALTSGSDKIFVEFPTKCGVPNYINARNITVNGIKCRYASVSGNTITVTTPTHINANSGVTVVISKDAKIKNPSVYGTYTFKVHTSKDVVAVSYSVNIKKSTIAKPTVNLSSYAVGDTPTITINFTTGSAGALKRNQDKIYVLFPAEFKIPFSIQANSIKINNITVKQVSRYVSRLEITTPVDIPANGSVTVVIDKTAGIKNPEAIGDYTLTVYTSKEDTPIESETFKIVALPKTTIAVNPPQPDGKNGYYTTNPVVTLTAVSPVDPNPMIYYYIDSGSSILYTQSFTIPDGKHTLYYYAVDHQGNKEKVQSQNFLVDTKSPVVTIISPKNGAVLNTKQCKIVGKTEPGATLEINGKDVPVATDGSFTFAAQISGETVFKITAEDKAGNKTTVNLKVSLDTTPPKLTVATPIAFQEFHTPTVTVTGKTEKNATVTVNGAKVQVNGENYTFSYTLMLTKPGLNSINVIATDLAGNTTKVSVPVKFIPKTKIVLQVGNSKAIVNNEIVKLDAPPVLVNNRTMVPLRFIAEAFGAKVEWNPVFKLVFITLGEKEIILQVGTPYASVNNKMVNLDAPPKIIKNHTMVPLRFIAEVFGASVEWDKKTKGITIVYPK